MTELDKDKLREWISAHPLSQFCNIEKGLEDRLDSKSHPEIMDRIMDAYQLTKDYNNNVISEFHANDMWKNSTDRVRADLSGALLSRSPEAESILQNLWRNSCSEHLIKYIQFSDLSDGKEDAKLYLQYRILKDLSRWAIFANCSDMTQLGVPKVGNPFGCLFYNVLITGASIHSHYYAEKVSALISGVDHPIVVEIGGGVGMLAYYLNRSNNSLRYVNFDLPEILAINQYFLMLTFPDKRFKLFGEDTEDFDIALLPTFSIKDVPDNSCDVVVNIHSLSEMTENTANAYLSQIGRIAKDYFYCENSVEKQEYNEVSMDTLNIPNNMVRLYKSYAIWGEPIYVEFLYKRLDG